MLMKTLSLTLAVYFAFGCGVKKSKNDDYVEPADSTKVSPSRDQKNPDQIPNSSNSQPADQPSVFANQPLEDLTPKLISKFIFKPNRCESERINFGQEIALNGSKKIQIVVSKGSHECAILARPPATGRIDVSKSSIYPQFLIGNSWVQYKVCGDGKAEICKLRADIAEYLEFQSVGKSVFFSWDNFSCRKFFDDQDRGIFHYTTDCIGEVTVEIYGLP